MRTPSIVFYASVLILAHFFHVKLILSAILLIAILISIAFRFFGVQHLLQQDVPKNAAAFVTGANGGIGQAICLSLAYRKVVVFAGVRKMENGKSLVESAPASFQPYIIPVICDVTQSSSLVDACNTIKNELRKRNISGLWSVISNAGIMPYAPVEEMDDKMHRQCFGKLFCLDLIFGLVFTKGESLKMSTILEQSHSYNSLFLCAENSASSTKQEVTLLSSPVSEDWYPLRAFLLMLRQSLLLKDSQTL